MLKGFLLFALLLLTSAVVSATPGAPSDSGFPPQVCAMTFEVPSPC
jgi:hypothetical protein